MPTEIRCPSCNRQLKVPENLLGKMVRCPGCQQTFTATAESSPAPAPVQPRPSAPASRPRRPADEEPDEGIREEAPVRRSRPAADDYDEGGAEAYDEDEDRPRRRRGAASAEAASLVAGPAIAIMVVAILDLVFGVIGLILRMLGIGLVAAQGAGPGAPAGAGGNDMAAMAGGVVGNILGLVLGGLMLTGALRMKGLQSYGLAMTACIVAILPCHTCCILGIPFGIWGLVMLNRPEVKEAFT